MNTLLRLTFSIWLALVPGTAWASDTLRGAQHAEAGLESSLERALVQAPSRAAAGAEESATYAHLIRLADPTLQRYLDDDAWAHENFQVLAEVFGGDERARAVVHERAKQVGLTPYEVVQGLLHQQTLEGFLRHARPADLQGAWRQYWGDPHDLAAGFVWEARSQEQYDIVTFGGGTSAQINRQSLRTHPATRGWRVASVATGSDNGGRTVRMAEGDERRGIRGLRHAVGHHVFRVGDLTAIFKGTFNEAFAGQVLEPDAGTWAAAGATLEARVGTLLTWYVASRPDDIKNRDPDVWPNIVSWAVELLNAARLADHYVIGRAYGLETTSVRHAIFDGLWMAVGAYGAKEGRQLSAPDSDRFEVGLFLLERAFELPTRMLPNSLDAQDLVAVWANGHREEGQVRISIAPDGAKRNAGGQLTPIVGFRFQQDGVRAYPGVLQAIAQLAPRGVVGIGPSSIVVSAGATLLPAGTIETIAERPEIPVIINVNLTLNNETIGSTATTYMAFVHHLLFRELVPPQRQVWVFNTRYPGSPWIGELTPQARQSLEQAFADAWTPGVDDLDVYKSRGRVPLPGGLDQATPRVIGRLKHGEPVDEVLPGSEVAALLAQGPTIILSPMAHHATRDQYVGGQRQMVRGIFHEPSRLGAVYALVSDSAAQIGSAGQLYLQEGRLGQATLIPLGARQAGADAQAAAAAASKGGLEETAVREAFQALLGRRDLAREIRWPSHWTPAEIQATVDGAIKTMTAIALQEHAPLTDPQALQAYLVRRFGVRTIVMGAGRSRRFSEDPFESKVLFRADGINPVIKHALEAARINSPAWQAVVQDVVVLSYNVVYHLLAERVIPPTERRALAKTVADGVAGFLETIKVPAATRELIGKAVSEALDALEVTTATEPNAQDFRRMIGQLARQLEEAAPTLDQRLREAIVDEVGYLIQAEWLRQPGAIDLGKQADLLGEHVLVILSRIRGPGGSYFETMQVLEDRGLLTETRFHNVVYGDYAPAILDQFPHVYLVSYLTALNQLGWQYNRQPRFSEQQLTGDSALGQLPVVVWGVKSPLDQKGVVGRGQAMLLLTPFGPLPSANKEWDTLTPGEQAVQQELAAESLRRRDQPPVHFVNGGVFLFDSEWALRAFEERLFVDPRYAHTAPRLNLVEYWYTDLVELAYRASVEGWQGNPRAPPLVKMVSLGDEAPSGIGNLRLAQQYRADYRAMLRRRLKAGLEDTLAALLARLQDPLEQRARLGPPVKIILSDLDKAAAVKSDAPVAVRSQARIAMYVAAGGIYGLVTTRDSASATGRLGRDAIMDMLPPGAAARLRLTESVRVYGRFGSDQLRALIRERSRGRYLTIERLQEAITEIATQIPAHGATPDGPWQGLDVGEALVPETDEAVLVRNRDMRIFQRGGFGLYVPSGADGGEAPEEDHTFAIITVYGVRNRAPEGPERDAFDPRPRIVEELRKRFPGADITSTGFGSINVTWINKADLVKLVATQHGTPGEVAFIDDEGAPDGTGRKGLELAKTLGIVGLLVGEPDDTLPPEVIQSTRRGPEAHDRFLEIQTAKLLGQPTRAALDEELTAVLQALPTGSTTAAEAVELIRAHAPDDWRALLQLATPGAREKVILIAPEAAQPAVFMGLAALQRPGPQVIVVARDAAQAQDVEAEARDAGLVLAGPIVDLASRYGGDLDAAIDERRQQYGSDTLRVLMTADRLPALGFELGMPDALIPYWFKWIQQQAGAEEAFAWAA